MLQCETKSRQSFAILRDRPTLAKIEFQHNGKEQQLSLYQTGKILLLELLKPDTLMGGMLIDKQQIRPGLTHKVTVLVLSDDT